MMLLRIFSPRVDECVAGQFVLYKFLVEPPRSLKAMDSKEGGQ